MTQQALPHQYIILTNPEAESATLSETIERAGGRIIYKVGRNALIIQVDKPETEVTELLPTGVRLLRPQDPIPEGWSTSDAIQLRAFRLRQSTNFRQAKQIRPHEGQQWGTNDLPEPGKEDEMNPGAGQISLPGADETVVIPTNERLINDVAVGVVLVNGHGQYAISKEEKEHIVAEIQEGLGWLGNLEPDASVSWALDVSEVTVDITPWAGARWPGMPDSFFKGIDAALLRQDNGKIYFFKGDQYVRFSNVSSGVDPGYPKPIADKWPGLPPDFQTGIDAAFWRESNGKIYFFKGNQYVRFSNVTEGVDPGYPKPIAGNWNGLPVSFQSGVDAVLMREENHKIYFFKGTRYVRYSDAENTTDAGYPTTINSNWMPFPR